MNKFITLIICLALLLVAGGVTTIVFLTEPKATRETATKKTAMLVDVVTVERGDFRPVIEVMGNVVPEQEIHLSPRVGGEIITVSPTFTPGGFVDKGELLLEIDPADYEAALMERESALRQAMADLELEQGRQDVAKKDYELLDQALSSSNKSLVLREPQLNIAMARVEAARASLRQAELDLERTRIVAPFDAHIISRNANLGSLVSPGDEIGELVGIDTYWIEAAVPLSKLPWITFPDEGSMRASTVKIEDRIKRTGEFLEGTVHRLIGALEPDTRMARVLITVDDPLARNPENADKSPLMIGTFVEAEIEGKMINGVVRLNRDYLRKDDTVWVMNEGQLDIREVFIVFRDAEYVYVSDGLEDGDQIVTTNLSRVAEGAELRTEGEPE